MTTEQAILVIESVIQRTPLSQAEVMGVVAALEHLKKETAKPEQVPTVLEAKES